MPHDRLYTTDQYPLSVDVFEPDGETPAEADSATVDIFNQITLVQVVDGEQCNVEMGLVTYWIEADSDISANPGRYVAFMQVQLDTNNLQTHRIAFSVLGKGSDLAVERWIRKTQDAAPDEHSVSEDYARDWIDDAVDLLRRDYNLEYTSVLANITPAPNGPDMELITSVAALMARYAWWAGKGSWRDEEMSFDGSPFQQEWTRLENRLGSAGTLSEWFSAPAFAEVTDLFNRDKTDVHGIPDDPDEYYRMKWATDA